MIVDSHLHLWDLQIGTYSWLGPQHGELYRSFGPAEAARELAAAGVSSAVLVQAEDSLTDTRYLLDVARHHPWVHGVVGWVPLDAPDDAARALDELACPALRGIRHLVHDDPRDEFLDLPEVRKSLGLVAGRGLAFDVPDAWPRHLAAVGRLADALPELTVVVDHLGKPPRGTNRMDAWAQCLREVSRRPNVVAKLSGLQRPGQPFTVDALRPVLAVALAAFGADRLMVGSDWPMTIGDGGYRRTAHVLQELIDELADSDKTAIRHGTAVRVYGEES